MLKPVLCFHMASFNYGAKGVRDVDPTCSVIRATVCNLWLSLLLLYSLFKKMFCVCVSVSVCLCV